MEEEIIALKLSQDQRKLLQKYKTGFSDPEISSLCSLALRKDDAYEINLTREQLEELHFELCNLMSNESNPKRQSELVELCCHLEDYMPGFVEFGEDEDEDEDEDSKYSKNIGNVYVLKVALENDKKIWREIAIRGGQTLHDFHDAIYDAFDRDDDHLYSFYFPTVHCKPGTRKMMQTAEEYTHPFSFDGPPMFEQEGKNAAKASIESLDLRNKQKFTGIP